MKLILAALVAAATFSSILATSPLRCGPNQVFSSCAKVKDCQLSCANRNDPPQVCVESCYQGCVCKDGFVWDENDQCVEPDQCPSCDDENPTDPPEPTEPTEPPQPECGKNEVYSTCATAPGCQTTCSNRNGPFPACIAMCFQACVCKQGYIWNDKKKCVKPEQCPKDEPITEKPLPPACGENEEFSSCAIDPKCRKTCANQNNPPLACNKKCYQECVCKSGFVLNDDGKCVKSEDCPPCDDDETTTKAPPPPPQCGKNEVFSSCVSVLACRKSCANKNGLPCRAPCRPGCDCKDGFVLNNGKCIKAKNCPVVEESTTQTPTTEAPPPPQCEANQVFQKCAIDPKCRKTCANRNNPPRACNKRCYQECVCKPDFVLNDDGICVKPEDCPPCDDDETTTQPPPPQCGANQVFSTCAPAPGCRKSCASLKGPRKVCIQSCFSACVCKPGYILNDKGKCIKPEKCPIDPKPTEPPTPKCGINQEYSTCAIASGCRRSCANLNGPMPSCVKKCYKACVCKQGYVIYNKNKCVKPSQCPVKKTTTPRPTKPLQPQCGANQVFQSCAKDPNCQASCSNLSNPPRTCNRRCYRACVCKSGYVWNDKKKCVKPSQCPAKKTTTPRPTKPPQPQCGANQVFQSCAKDPNCQASCSNLSNPPRACNRRCYRACVCKSGYIWNDKKKCVKPSQCPAKKTTTVRPTRPPQPLCGLNQVFKTCAKAKQCQLSCENYSNPPKICVKSCYRGCICSDGYVWNKNNKCVKPSQCEKPTEEPEDNAVENSCSEESKKSISKSWSSSSESCESSE